MQYIDYVYGIVHIKYRMFLTSVTPVNLIKLRKKVKGWKKICLETVTIWDLE